MSGGLQTRPFMDDRLWKRKEEDPAGKDEREEGEDCKDELVERNGMCSPEEYIEAADRQRKVFKHIYSLDWKDMIYGQDADP